MQSKVVHVHPAPVDELLRHHGKRKRAVRNFTWEESLMTLPWPLFLIDFFLLPSNDASNGDNEVISRWIDVIQPFSVSLANSHRDIGCAEGHDAGSGICQSPARLS